MSTQCVQPLYSYVFHMLSFYVGVAYNRLTAHWALWLFRFPDQFQTAAVVHGMLVTQVMVLNSWWRVPFRALFTAYWTDGGMYRGPCSTFMYACFFTLILVWCVKSSHIKNQSSFYPTEDILYQYGVRQSLQRELILHNVTTILGITNTTHSRSSLQIFVIILAVKSKCGAMFFRYQSCSLPNDLHELLRAPNRHISPSEGIDRITELDELVMQMCPSRVIYVLVF